MPHPVVDFARVRAITFDAGGTLLTPNPGVGEVYAEILAQYGVAISPPILNQRFRVVFKELTATRPRAVVNEATELAFWHEVVRGSVTPECPADLLDQVFHQLWREFASAKRWRALPGAAETLANLSAQKDLQLAILSNWDSRLRQVVTELGWSPYLAGGLFISSEIHAEKPDPRAFRAVEQALHLPASAILHIGDSQPHDYAAARAAGWQAMLVTSTPHEGVPCLASLAELPGLLGGR